MERANSLKKTLMLGKIEGKRRRGWQRMIRWLDDITDSMNMNLSQPWDFFGRNEVKAETLVLWPPHAKS